jgi:hypothetical protein
MFRALFFAVLFLFVGQVTGATAALAATAACGESCPDEEPEKHCAPTCTHCTCGVQLAIVAPAPRLSPVCVVPEAPPDDRPLADGAAAPPMPDPREILRVPR